MKHLDLFSGIGGFALAADRVFGNVEHTFCEIDPFCQEVLKKHWPQAKIYGDIKRFTPPSSDLITGGFPCQPFSQTGQRRGTEDDRHLWPEMLRVISLSKPKWVIGENVYGLLTWNEGMVLKKVLSDLEDIGYATLPPLVIPACGVNAPHKRDRVWIVAYAKSIGWSKVDKEQENRLPTKHHEGFESFWGCCSDLHLALEPDWNKPSRGVGRNDDGLSSGVDRLKALGNSIVPQVAEEIMRAIQGTTANLFAR